MMREDISLSCKSLWSEKLSLTQSNFRIEIVSQSFDYEAHRSWRKTLNEKASMTKKTLILPVVILIKWKSFNAYTLWHTVERIKSLLSVYDTMKLIKS